MNIVLTTLDGVDLRSLPDNMRKELESLDYHKELTPLLVSEGDVKGVVAKVFEPDEEGETHVATIFMKPDESLIYKVFRLSGKTTLVPDDEDTDRKYLKILYNCDDNLIQSYLTLVTLYKEDSKLKRTN